MKLLAFDTSTAQGSVALFDGAQLLGERRWQRAQSHSEFLTSEIESLLTEQRLTPAALDALAVGQGPGSFTGIRVAINAARALAYALERKVYVFETSAILVQPIARTDLPILTIINAQKNSFYVSRFEVSGATPDLAFSRSLNLQFMNLAALEALLNRPHLCIGDGCREAEPFLSPEAKLNLVRDASLSDFPLATALGRLTFAPSKATSPSDWNAVQPLYIRASGAEEKLREGL